MTELRNVYTTEANGIPKDFTDVSSSTKRKFLQKGQLNQLRVRPQIINEHAESSRELMDTVTSTNIVGQIFKASHDNINGIMLTLEPAGGTSTDNFESYANSAALQAAWVLTGTNNALLETTIVNGGTKSMNLPLDKLNDTWTKTISPTDYTNSSFTFDFYQTTSFANAQVSFFIGDGTNTKSVTIPISTIDVWEGFTVDEVNMVNDGGTPPTMSAITKIGFRVDNQKNNNNAYVDNLVSITEPGQVELKLWDLGATLPVGDGLSFALNPDATQYTTLGDLGESPAVTSILLDLKSGKRLYSINDFIAGVALEIPTNATLTVNNYYAVTLHYVDTDVAIYGPDTTLSINYYSSGYAFYTASEATNITTIPGAAGSGAYSDLMFSVFSTQDVYVTSFFQAIDGTPGSDSRTTVQVEDSNMGIVGVYAHGTPAVSSIFADVKFRPMFLEKGGKLEQYYNDDASDNTTFINLTMGFVFKPEVTNG